MQFLCYIFSDQTKTQQERMYFRMASITQDMRYRLSLINYADRYGVSNAAQKYKTNHQYIYRRKNRHDVSYDSLRNRSRHPIPRSTASLKAGNPGRKTFQSQVCSKTL